MCCLLKFVGRKRPKGLFVGRNIPNRFILLVLFALVNCSIGIAQTLTMSREELRSSDLETGLSSSEDCAALEVTSLSTPYKAKDIRCALKEKDERRIRSRFQFLPSIKVRRPDDNDRACHFYADKVCFYETDFVSGL